MCNVILLNYYVQVPVPVPYLYYKTENVNSGILSLSIFLVGFLTIQSYYTSTNDISRIAVCK